MLNINGGIVLTDTQKNMIKTGTIAQRQSALINGLMQNVGDFNKEMAKTSWGKNMKLNNQYNELMFTLGEKMILIKNQFKELGVAVLPSFITVMNTVAGVIGLVVRLFTRLFDIWNWLHTPIQKTNGALTTTEKILNAIKGIFYIFETMVLMKFFWFLYVLEDIWIWLNGGKSLIGFIIDLVKKLGAYIWDMAKTKVRGWFNEWKNGFFNLWKEMSDGMSEIRKGFVEKFSEAFHIAINNIKKAFRDLMNWIPQQWEKLKSKLPDWMGGSPKVDVQTTKNAIDTSSVKGEMNKMKNDKPNEKTNNINISPGAVVLSVNGTAMGMTPEDIKKIVDEGLNSAIDKMLIGVDIT